MPLVIDERSRTSTSSKDTIPIGRDESHEPAEREVPRVRDRCLLTLLSGEHIGAFFHVSEHGLVVGRGDDADARIDDPYVSRRHARFSMVDGIPYVADLGSCNGTYVAGQRIAEPQMLRHGQHVRLGRDVILRSGLYDAVEERALLELYESSFEDLLTGAHNRRYFETQLDAERAYGRRHSTPLSVLLFDVDHFKHVNDAFGHQVGDGVLRVVATAVQRVLRPEDVLARYGGDEFAVLLRDTSGREAEILSERIRRTIERLPFRPRGRDLRVSVSVGVSTLEPGGDSDGQTLMTVADEAMYEAKARGRNCVVSLTRH
ncbi:MAG: GGDEF domain-containing protein [Myxococcales bacterium]|nr:GGDEF domain-containing protein [Myxococcales bacterium]